MGRENDLMEVKFKPKPGQADYTNIRWAPVINCILRYKGKILLVQRSKNLHFFPGYWSGISGFLDDHKSLKEKVAEELLEETGISKNKIRKVIVGRIFDQESPRQNKTWIVHPVLVDINTDKIKLDWEAKSFHWTTFNKAKKLNLMPGFINVLNELENV